jgi:hypothetical protein
MDSCNLLSSAGHDGVFVPLLVDDLPRFMDAFQGHDFQVGSAAVEHGNSPTAHVLLFMCVMY